MSKLLKFNGSSTYATLPMSLNLEEGSSTRSFWLKVSGVGNYAVISNYPSTANLAIDIISGRIRYYRNANPNSGGMSEPIEVDKWIHITLTRNIVTGVNKGYTNGVLYGTVADPKTSIVSDKACRLGAYLNGTATGPFYFGVMTDVKFWNVAVDDDQAMEIFKGASVAHDNLLAHYKLSEGVGTTLFDYSGNGNDITVVNGTWVDDTLPSGKAPKILIHANGVVYTHKSGAWVNLGVIPGPGEVRDMLYYTEGMSSISLPQIEELKLLVPSNKFQIGYYNGPKRFIGLDFVDHPDPFLDSSGLMLIPFNGDSLDALENITIPTSVTYSAGKFGQAMVMNGSSTNVNVGTILAKRKEFTLSLWLKKATAGTYHGIVGNYIGAGFWLQTDSVGGIGLPREISLSGTDYTFSARNVCDDKFHHIVVTKVGKSVILYIDGTLELNLTANTDWAFSDEPLYLGMLGTSIPRTFPGQIDQVRMFNRALTAPEVARLYVEL